MPSGMPRKTVAPPKPNGTAFAAYAGVPELAAELTRRLSGELPADFAPKPGLHR
jgi:hypothetical protein